MPPQSDGAVPAVVRVYGGSVFYSMPADAGPAVSPPAFSGQLYAAAGYAVIYPSTPLGRGGETDMPETLAKQVVAAIDAAAEAGFVDPERVAVIGQSFGGYSVAAVLARRSDRFRAGIALAGNYDWMMSYGTRGLEELFRGTAADTPVFIEYIENGQPGLLRPYWEDPLPYVRNSPIFEVDSIDAPLLMLHGDMDLGPTSFVGAGRMYAALVRAGQQPTLVRYWGEGHMVRSEAGVRDQWQRISKWLDAHLQRRPARQDSAGSDRWRDSLEGKRWARTASARQRASPPVPAKITAPAIPRYCANPEVVHPYAICNPRALVCSKTRRWRRTDHPERCHVQPLVEPR